jgi:hypothetical protein
MSVNEIFKLSNIQSGRYCELLFISSRDVIHLTYPSLGRKDFAFGSSRNNVPFWYACLAETSLHVFSAVLAVAAYAVAIARPTIPPTEARLKYRAFILKGNYLVQCRQVIPPLA